MGKESTLNNLHILINYFKDNGNLDNSFFNEKEKLHLKDIKTLLYKTYLTVFFSFFALVLAIFKIKNILVYSLRIIGISFCFLLIIILPFLIAFNSSFLTFHQIAFSNFYWQLNPEVDRLIVMFPEEFFKSILKKAFINSLFIMIILYAV